MDLTAAVGLCLQGIEDPSALNPEQLSKELRAAGLDVTKMAAQIRKRISQAQDRIRLANNRSGLYRTDPITTVRRTFAELRAAVEQAIERISGIQPQAAAVFYRKLDESTPEDLESLLADILELEADQRGNETDGRG